MNDLDMSSLDDIELHETNEDLEDAAPKGLRFGFIGAGQAGCNLVYALRDKKDYRRTLFFNTTHKDIESIPEAYRVVPAGYDGAGKDRSIGAKAASSARGELTASMTKYFKKLDYIFICTSTAGGSGSGATPVILNVAREYLSNHSGYTKEEAARRVGVIAVLPNRSEGGAALSNTGLFMNDVLDSANKPTVTPLFLVDNERVTKMAKDAIGRFDKTNNVVATLFDIFNTICANQSRFMTFDPKDYGTILQSGLITAGLNTLERYEREDDIARAIRLNLSQTVLVDGFNVEGATHAAIIVTGDENVLGTIPSEALESARTTLLGMMGGTNATLHVGVYPASTKGIKVLTIIGGFSFPQHRRAELEARLTHTR